MSGEIDALYIYDEQNQPLVEQVYRSRPPSAASIRPLYFTHPAPRPSLIYLPNTSPPVTIFSIVQSNLHFLALSETDTEPLLALEFLYRVVDILEEFVGAPLISTKIQANYDVVAQLLHEMCDAGIVCNTELNALQEVVEMPGWMGKLLGNVGLPGSSTPILGQASALKRQSLTSSGAAQGPAIPWRRPGVRHTSNELYVDIVESLTVTMAPSGRLLSALVSGTIAFTAKVSGVPDLLLSLTAPGGQHAIARKMELPVFHPCVRLARWRERPGELSFVPPDGRFILAGYEVDLLPLDPGLDQPPSHMEKLFLPTIVDIRKSLGSTGAEFEVRLTLNTNFPGHSSGSRTSRGGSGTSTPSFLGGSSGGNSTPVLEEVVVTVPIPQSVRNVTDMKASRGEALFTPGSGVLEWRVPTKDSGTVSGTATLRCTVVGHPSDDLDDEEADDPDADAQATLLQGYYDDSTAVSYQQNAEPELIKQKPKKKKKKVKKVKKSTSSRRSAAITSPQETDANPDETPLPPSNLNADQPPVSQPPSHPETPSLTPPPSNQQQSSQDSPFSIFHTAPRKSKTQINASLMPNSASVSFSVRGWLPSGIKVESLNIDQRRSRGLGEGVKPYKGVKYLCVSRKGIERRC
ncbi:Mu homology domain-containing protein [Aspergillus granulosus]|uniref:Mu homology domain-containing protein n=1 Tax=Aspergillus granulosus TaxID=176169 RepID=A0ABR4HVX9_9EURO